MEEKEDQRTKDIYRLVAALNDVFFDTALDAIVDWAFEVDKLDEIIATLKELRDGPIVKVEN